MAFAAGLRPAFRALRRRLSYEEYGGVPLLGVNGVCIVAHGRSTPLAMQNAIRAGANASSCAWWRRSATAWPASRSPRPDFRYLSCVLTWSPGEAAQGAAADVDVTRPV